MNFKIVQLSQFSGYHAGIYSIFLENEQETLFDRFIKENFISFKNEIIDITKISKQITERIKNKEIQFSEDGTEIFGNLEFNDNE